MEFDQFLWNSHAQCIYIYIYRCHPNQGLLPGSKSIIFGMSSKIQAFIVSWGHWVWNTATVFQRISLSGPLPGHPGDPRHLTLHTWKLHELKYPGAEKCTLLKHQWKTLHFFDSSCYVINVDVTPRKLTWNLKMLISIRTLPLQGFIFRFHVTFQGCSWYLLYL